MAVIRNADVIMAVANAERSIENGNLAAAVERINYATELYDLFEYHMGHIGAHMFPRYKAAKARVIRSGRYELNANGLLVLMQGAQSSKR